MQILTRGSPSFYGQIYTDSHTVRMCDFIPTVDSHWLLLVLVGEETKFTIFRDFPHVKFILNTRIKTKYDHIPSTVS